jgi:acylphosphatase
MTKAELVKIRLKIVGRVQGVFYRQATKERATALGLTGWVKNDSDGGVSVECLGTRERVDELIRWCRNGPPSAHVHGVQVESEESGMQDADTGRFEIKH